VRQRHRARNDLLLLFATYWNLGGKARPFQTSCQREMGHACEWETSMILRLAPHLVGHSRLNRSRRAMRLSRLPAADYQRPHPCRAHCAIQAAADRDKGVSASSTFSADVSFLRARARVGWQELERLTPEPAMSRPASWKWWICACCFASRRSPMDRQTLANARSASPSSFNSARSNYGNFELGFGWAFAVGSLVFGVLARSLSRRWGYPAALLLWSGWAFATGLVQSYKGLLVCRTLLGFFEAGHWPVRLKTTQRALEPADRSMEVTVCCKVAPPSGQSSYR